jgi:hypothetical protein
MPSPVWATCPATNAKVPSTRLNSAPFEALLDEKLYSLSAIRVLFTRSSAVPSGKAIPQLELAPVWTMSVL